MTTMFCERCGYDGPSEIPYADCPRCGRQETFGEFVIRASFAISRWIVGGIAFSVELFLVIVLLTMIDATAHHFDIPSYVAVMAVGVVYVIKRLSK